MMKEKKYCGKKFFLIGIGGISMSAIAKYILSEGGIVCGSDVRKSRIIDDLQRLGVNIFIGHNGANIKGYEAVIVNSAIAEDNPELLYARALGLKIYSRAEFLSSIMGDFSLSAGIAGCHGKTTATAMLSNICKAAGREFLAHIGGEDILLGNHYYSGKEIFIGEICEYKRNIDKFFVDVACVLNVGYDHADCYSNLNEVVSVYYAFLDRAKIRIINVDDGVLSKYGKASITYGLVNEADFFAKDVYYDGATLSFTLCAKGKYFNITMGVIGEHNVYNALAASATAYALGIDLEYVVKGLNAFKGIKRRFEFVGYINSARVICDYAHHPKEIASAIKTARGITKGRLIVVFQPHTYSRTKALMSEFLECFNGVDDLSIFKEYAARESFDAAGSAKSLYNNLITAKNYFNDIFELKKYLHKAACTGDTVLMLGAGDIYEKVLSVIN